MRFRIEKDDCLRCGVCRAITPAMFSQGEDGRALVIETDAVDIEKALEAAQMCPTDAIKTE